MQRPAFSHLQQISSLLMLLALLWLTVSLPVITRAQEVRIQWEQEQGLATEESGNPLAGTTEEKTPTAPGLNEYLHECGQLRHPGREQLLHQAGRFLSSYRAYHGEMLVPPPNR